jgi:hypothetical protein
MKIETTFSKGDKVFVINFLDTYISERIIDGIKLESIDFNYFKIEYFLLTTNKKYVGYMDEKYIFKSYKEAELYLIDYWNKKDIDYLKTIKEKI